MAEAKDERLQRALQHLEGVLMRSPRSTTSIVSAMRGSVARGPPRRSGACATAAQSAPHHASAAVAVRMMGPGWRKADRADVPNPTATAAKPVNAPAASNA